MSETSIDLDGSQQRMDTPLPQLHQHSPLSYEQPKHHSFPYGDLLSVRHDISSASNFTGPKLSPNRRRVLVGKFKSLPKLMPVKRSSSIGSCGSNSRAKKGVRWKPMIDLQNPKSLDNAALEMENLYCSTSSSEYKYPMHNKYNSLDTPDVKCADLQFLVSKTKPDGPLYCDLCQQKIQQISPSPNPERVGYEINLKHSFSAPLITNEHVEDSCGRDRRNSWQSKFLDKIGFRTRRRTSSPYSEPQCKPGTTDCISFSSQSLPNIALWADCSLPAGVEQLEEIGSTFDPLDTTGEGRSRGNVFPLLNSAELPCVKTPVVPYSVLEMDASFPPTSRKDSDILSESSLDASSWKSADWTTLLGGDVRSS
jgi:hypothetical protein